MLAKTRTDHQIIFAINISLEILRLENIYKDNRQKAAVMRREAKSTKVKSDAFAMRKKATELSNEAADAKKKLAKEKKEFLETASTALRLITQRMPDTWTQWGVVKTRAYTNLISLAAAQLNRVKVDEQLVATALEGIKTHETWSDRQISHFAVLKATSKTINV